MHNTHQDNSARPVAIVTGGLRGLGLAIAHQMAKDGFDLAIIDLPPPTPEGQTTLAPLAELGARCKYYAMDISDIARHAETLEQIQHDFGPINCLVNNAGIAARPLTDILELTPEAFDRSLEVNLRGTFFLTQAFAKMLVSAPPSTPEVYRSIVIITSIAAEMVSIDRSQYNISKAGLSMVSRLFAIRLAHHGIHVHEVRPGFMRTEMTASAGSETIDQWIAQGRVPVPRWGRPDEVGSAVSALAGGKMPYMTGQALWVAGGLNVSCAT